MTPHEAQILLACRRLRVRRAARVHPGWPETRDPRPPITFPQRGPRGWRLASRLRPVLSLGSLLAAVVLGLCVGGCKPAGSAPPPLTPDAVPATLEQAFVDAPAEVGTTARAVAEAARQQDPEAILVLMELSSRPQLTPAQHAAISASMNGLLDQARQRAAQGDARAADVVEKYRASK